MISRLPADIQSYVFDSFLPDLVEVESVLRLSLVRLEVVEGRASCG